MKRNFVLTYCYGKFICLGRKWSEVNCNIACSGGFHFMWFECNFTVFLPLFRPLMIYVIGLTHADVYYIIIACIKCLIIQCLTTFIVLIGWN
jgi:hypothetical protein